MTPLVSHFLYKYKAWKKKPGKTAMDGTVAEEFNKLKLEGERKTPRMGGIVIWGSSLITIVAIALVASFFPSIDEVR
ncbi:MAG: phospho-N-acetylmuramoyl-pentapeptide-transferase, phospho-N-acetylmuramoyl-pentapeptide-transferase, partial [Candidatus Parcubacteria bacterium]